MPAGVIRPMPNIATARLSSSTRGILWMVLATVVLASTNVYAKILTADYPVMQLVWARYIFHMAMVAVVLRAGLGGAFRTGHVKTQLSRSVLLAVATALYFGGLYFIQIAEASATTFITPVIVTALAVPLLGERVGLRRWIGVGVGCAGALIIIRPGLGMMHIAILLPFGTALCHALYQIATRRVADTDSALTSLVYTGIVGAVLSSAIVPFYWVAPDGVGWLLMILVGVSAGAGHFFLIKAYKVAEAPAVAPFFYMHFVWTTFFGLVVFGEIPDVWTFAGAGVIAASGLYIYHRENMRRK